MWKMSKKAIISLSPNGLEPVGLDCDKCSTFTGHCTARTKKDWAEGIKAHDAMVRELALYKECYEAHTDYDASKLVAMGSGEDTEKEWQRWQDAVDAVEKFKDGKE